MDIIKYILEFKDKTYNDLFPAHTPCATIESANMHKFDITHSKLIQINDELKKMVKSFQYVNNCLHQSDDIVQPYYNHLVLKAAGNIESLISSKRDLEDYLNHLKLLNSKNDMNVLNLFEVTNKIESFREKPYHVLFPAHAPFVSQEAANGYKLETTMEKFLENEKDIEYMIQCLNFIKTYEVGADETAKKYYQSLIQKAQNNILSLTKSKTDLEEHLSYLKSEKDMSLNTDKKIGWEHIE
jgi:hypothetical protein